jgi:hypothetical protein
VLQLKSDKFHVQLGAFHRNIKMGKKLTIFIFFNIYFWLSLPSSKWGAKGKRLLQHDSVIKFNVFFFSLFFLLHPKFEYQLIPNSAWKDYSAKTNYAFDAFADHDEKPNGKARNGANSRSSTATMHNGISQQTTLQMSHSPNKSQYYDISRNGNRYGGGEHHHQPR